jgi:hypothetical protein
VSRAADRQQRERDRQRCGDDCWRTHLGCLVTKATAAAYERHPGLLPEDQVRQLMVAASGVFLAYGRFPTEGDRACSHRARIGRKFYGCTLFGGHTGPCLFEPGEEAS